MRTPRPPRDIPPPLELECLKALWTLGEGNVGQVRQALAPRRRLAYTTVMTLMDRLAKKGAAGRRKVGRSFVYSPTLSREAIRRLAVDDLVQSFFGGSVEELVSWLARRESGGVGTSAAPVESPLDTALL